MNNDSMLEMFIYENNQLTERLEEVLIEGERNHELDEGHINEVFRIMHTIKGSAAMMGYASIAALGHVVEDMFFYIREHKDAAPNWQTIVDLCLESLDFFRAETAKIQSGGTPDSDNSLLLDRIQAYMEILTNGGEAPAAEASSAPEASSGETPASADSDSSAEGGNHVKLHIFFDAGIKMENVRAYQIALMLTEICEELRSEPAELLDDCAEEIVQNGVVFYLRTFVSEEAIREKVGGSIYVDKYELTYEEGPKPDEDENFPQSKSSVLEETADASSSTAEQTLSEEITPSKTAKAKEAAPMEIGLPTVVDTAEKAAPAKTAGTAKSSYISVSVDKLDKLMDLVGELVTSVLMVTQNPDLKDIALPNFEKAAAQLRKNTDEMQEIIMSVRMIPVASTFHKMQRIVRDTTRKINKEVELQILGEETEVDKNIIDHLSDPLMHIIRNSLDHGIEDSKETRIAAGKSGVGKIVLEARNAGGEVIISITDDGRGFDKSRILEKAIRQGIITNASDLSDREIFGLTLLPGFSTKEQVTELSGRGVGMDVVRRNIEEVGGSITLDSIAGEGSTVTINIPLTLAILNGMAIRVGGNMYILPILNIRESFKPLQENIIVDPEGEEMIMVRGEVYPIVRLHRLFGVYDAAERLEDGIMIMGEDNGRTIGIFADELIGEQQVVVKPIPAFIQKRIGSIRGISGATILGNGCICLIVDAKAILDMK